ncbi:MAG: outer membrane protein assembly factor BamE, partial [Gammaproteobacteria bacterium]
MIIKDLIKNNLAIFLFLTASTVHAGIDDFIDSLSTKVQNKLSENGIKPYVIELEQGRLIDDKKFNQLAIGLSKEQIEYLLGKPAKSPFNDNQWDYYYSNNIEEDEIKSLSVYFKNEKVFKITINNKIYKVFGQIKQSDVDLSLAPMAQVTNSQEDVSKESIIKITLEDVLNDGEELGLCKLNLYETFKDVKTLTLADESTLEIRADNQSQEGAIFTAEGNAEAERQNDMLKADKITYDTSSKKVSALGEVKYFSDEISIYSKSAEYEGNKSDIGFSQAKYFRASGIGSGVSDKITFKSNKDVFLKNATYTSCNIDDPDWQLTSTSTTLYNSTERGHSYNMILKYKNIPIFYTPFISYPLTDKRQSGILTP